MVGVLGVGCGVEEEDFRRWCEEGGFEEGRRDLWWWVLVAVGGWGVEVGEAEGEWREGGWCWSWWLVGGDGARGEKGCLVAGAWLKRSDEAVVK